MLNRQICDNVKLAFINWIAVFCWYFKGYSLTLVTSMDKSEKTKANKQENKKFIPVQIFSDSKRKA